MKYACPHCHAEAFAGDTICPSCELPYHPDPHEKKFRRLVMLLIALSFTALFMFACVSWLPTGFLLWHEVTEFWEEFELCPGCY